MCLRGATGITEFARKDSIYLLDETKGKFGLNGSGFFAKSKDFLFFGGVARNIFNFGRLNFSKIFFEGKYNNFFSRAVHNFVADGNSNNFLKGGAFVIGSLVTLVGAVARVGFTAIFTAVAAVTQLATTISAASVAVVVSASALALLIALGGPISCYLLYKQNETNEKHAATLNTLQSQLQQLQNPPAPLISNAHAGGS